MMTGFSVSDVAASFVLLEGKNFRISKVIVKEFSQIQNF